MVGFILTGHGQFAPGLASAIAMVAGDQPAFTVVPFEGDQAASYGEDLRAAITAMREECDGVLVFTESARTGRNSHKHTKLSARFR